MDINLRQVALTLATVAGLAFFAGYQVATRGVIDGLENPWPPIVDTNKVISATIESIKSESRLVSYSYVGTQNVSIDRSYWYIFKGHQQLIVPTTVSYFIDLAKLTQSSATFDENTNTVKVTLPKLMLSVAFDPRKATIINSGVVVLNNSVSQALTKLNYNTALKSAIKQGQQTELVRSAKDKTKQNIERLFRVPLQAVGKTDVKVIVAFGN